MCRGISPLGTAKQGQRLTRAEQVGHGHACLKLNVLAKQADGTLD
jgi:hypothetical protein